MLFLFSFTCTHLQFQVSRTNSPPQSFEVRIKLSAVHVAIEAVTALSSCPLPGAYVWDRRVILLDENVGAFSTHCPPHPLPMNPAFILCPSLPVPVSLCK